MLSMVSMADAAVSAAALPTRARSRKGTWLTCAHTPELRSHVTESADPAACASPAAASAFARPQGRPKAYLFGTGAQVAGSVKIAGQQPISKVNYAHTTRVAALKGGALGPHPARDPV
jgi:hypothetical protein